MVEVENIENMTVEELLEKREHLLFVVREIEDILRQQGIIVDD